MLKVLSPRTPGRSNIGPLRRGSLVRGNAYCFLDRYSYLDEQPFARGTFGRVHRCVDSLAQIPRAVKRIMVPEEEMLAEALSSEICTLGALEHPHIVRLIEYFVQDGEVLLVMELLSGPSLGDRVRGEGRFGEALSARCLRHMLKAVMCCHCQGIAHNDVSSWNFRFQSPAPEASLKMVDFGLSERCAQATPPSSREGARNCFVQKRDVWSAGAILYEMLAGEVLLSGDGGGKAAIEVETDPGFVPRQLRALKASDEARELLGLMLEPSTEQRLSAREALKHRFICSSYPAQNVELQAGPGRWTLEECLAAFQEFHRVSRLKRLALLVVAHLVDESDLVVQAIEWHFRCLVRDAWQLEESVLRARLADEQLEVPENFGELYASADTKGAGGLDHMEFLAVSLSEVPEIYCQPSMLQAAFGYLDSGDTGFIDSGSLRAVLPKADGGEDMDQWVPEACLGKTEIRFKDFRRMMVPSQWDNSPAGGKAAYWAAMPDEEPRSPQAGPSANPLPTAVSRATASSGSGAEGSGREDGQGEGTPREVNPIQSAPSELFAVRQMPGFHASAMRLYYGALPVSNVVMGIVRGTSSYARRAVELGLAEAVEAPLGGSRCSFFVMPNPKYHWTPEDALGATKLRFVVWWIHPALTGPLQEWVRALAGARSGGDAPLGLPLPRGRSVSSDFAVTEEVGSPGDFGFSEVAKPPDYLHTLRDLGSAHVAMLEELQSTARSYLKRVLGADLATARISAGFHYPVRPQYSTLHLQLRVNSGDVCGGKETRGVDLFQLLPLLREDPDLFNRDDAMVHYRANLNLRVALLEAASTAGLPVREVGCQSLVLG